MQSTKLLEEFQTILQDVANDLHKHTGESKFWKGNMTISTYSQGQTLDAKFTLIVSTNSSKFGYSIDFDKGEHIVGPVYKDDATQCYEHIYCLIISQLGNKVLNSLLK